MRKSHLILGLAVLAVTACSEREVKPLKDLRSFDRTPEEFSIVPNRPLETPESLATLPNPTPGQGNRADQNPLADAVAALGGDPSRVSGGGIPASDGALVNAASRNGRDSNIKAQLAAEDLDFRKRRSRFTFSIVPVDYYERVYRSQKLDPYRWLNRYRNAGARTPSAPPRN